MILIPLTQGKFAKIDDEDYEPVSRYRWHSSKRGDNMFDARTSTRKPDNSRFELKMHRLIMQPEPGQRIDHRNGDPLDNRRDNLRVCTAAQNAWNMRSKGGKSIYKGVSKTYYHKWVAEIWVNYKKIHLGVHESQLEAALTYDEAARKYHGEFAWLNFPEIDWT